VLKLQDDRSHGYFREKCRDEVRFDIESSDVFESSGNCLKNLDRVCTLFTPMMTCVQPRHKCQDDKHKGTAECREEEKKPGYAVMMR